MSGTGSPVTEGACPKCNIKMAREGAAGQIIVCRTCGFTFLDLDVIRVEQKKWLRDGLLENGWPNVPAEGEGQ